jgi:hypothetical protein
MQRDDPSTHCGCGFYMPGPMHRVDCKLYDDFVKRRLDKGDATISFAMNLTSGLSRDLGFITAMVYCNEAKLASLLKTMCDDPAVDESYTKSIEEIRKSLIVALDETQAHGDTCWCSKCSKERSLKGV